MGLQLQDSVVGQLRPVQAPANPLELAKASLGIKQQRQAIQQNQQQIDKDQLAAEDERLLHESAQRNGGDPAKILADVKTRNPLLGMKLEDAINQRRKTQLDVVAQEHKAINQMLQGVTDQASWDQGLQRLEQALPGITQQMGAYDPARVQQMKQEGLTFEEKLAQERMNLEKFKTGAEAENRQMQRLIDAGKDIGKPIEVSPGATLHDPSGMRPDFTAPNRPTTDSSVTPFEQWQKENPGKPVSDWLALEAKNRPQSTIAIQTINDDGAPVTRIVPKTQGSEFAAAPTTDARNRALAAQKSGPVLNRIADLSEKINTGSGLLAKAQGAAAKAAAKANYDDDVAEYEALVSGFTPLVARSLGHTGVLTEQDVQSVKALFPKPGDSKSLRDRKIAQVKSLTAEIADDAGGSQSTKPSRGPITEALIQSNMRANPSAKRADIIKALTEAGYAPTQAR